uniref:Alpha/beta hydrolase fold-3 domain-containing protein n=1 Tax=Salvator merianae TaxID=96440 RepID=A0A8D0BI87_SALMN
MVFWTRIACLLVTVAIYPTLFLVSIVIQYAKTSLPPGIEQPFKLRFYQSIMISLLLLVSVDLFWYDVAQLESVYRKVWMPDTSLLIQEQQFDGVPVKIYQPKKPAVTKRKALLFFHGGAGTYGNVAQRLSTLFRRRTDQQQNASIRSTNAGVLLAFCAMTVARKRPNADKYHTDASCVTVCGDSCGANFATKICQLLVDRTDVPKIQAQILIYPGLQGMDFYLPSYQQNKDIPLLWRKLVVYWTCRFLNKSTSVVNDVLEGRHVPEDIRTKYQKWVCADLIPEEFKVRGYKPQDPALRTFKPKVYEEMKQVLEVTFSPLFAENSVISKLPQACILTCEFDVLRDDGLLYKRRLEENGVPVTWFHAKKSIHGLAILFGYGQQEWLHSPAINLPY